MCLESEMTESCSGSQLESVSQHRCGCREGAAVSPPQGVMAEGCHGAHAQYTLLEGVRIDKEGLYETTQVWEGSLDPQTYPFPPHTVA